MKIVAYVHRYIPVHMAGAEVMLHSILKWVVARGHEATVLCAFEVQPGTFDGVKVIDRPVWDVIVNEGRQADVLFTHLDLTPMAIRLSRATRKPLVHLVHNDKQLRFHKVGSEDAQLVIYNSRWIQAGDTRMKRNSIVVHPPVFAEDYRVESTREKVTLINLTRAKGAHIFYQVARDMPELEFLGVTGGYGEQVQPPPNLKNLTILPQTPDIRRVYARTRILLMPSAYESYGRVAIEAAASGIPTIAYPTPGLVESMSHQGLFVESWDPHRWEGMIADLNDPDFYHLSSEMAEARFNELRPVEELEELEDALTVISSAAFRRTTQSEGPAPMGPLAFYASQPHYIDHMAPIWKEMDSVPFLVPDEAMRAHAGKRGVEATIGQPSEFRRLVVAGYVDMAAAEGISAFVLVEHGSGQTYSNRNPAHPGGRQRGKVELFLCPNYRVADLNREHYPEARIEVVGVPKMDVFYPPKAHRKHKRPVVALAFHWDGQEGAESGTAIDHFRKALPGLKEEFDVIGHGHPRFQKELSAIYRKAGIEFEPDWEKVFTQADVLAFDNTSLGYEFASLDRPVVVMNSPYWRKTVNHGLRFWEYADVGPQVDDPKLLDSAIMLALKDIPEQKERRREIIRALYPLRDGVAAGRAAEAIKALPERPSASRLSNRVVDGDRARLVTVRVTKPFFFMGGRTVKKGSEIDVTPEQFERWRGIQVEEI